MADEPKPTPWKAALPPELQSDPALKDIPDDIITFAKVFKDQKAFVGNSIRPPGPDAGPEARKEFIAKLQKHAPELVLIPDGDDDVAKAAREAVLQRLGKPADAKGYAPPKDVELPESVLEQLRTEAAEEGLTRAQFEIRARRAAAARSAAQEAEKGLRAALKAELGAAFEERTAAAASAAEKLGFPKALVSALKAGTVDLETYKAMAAVAKGFGESPEVANQNGGGSGKMTPDEARARRAEIMARPEYFNPKPAQMDIHRSLVAEVQRLNGLIEG